MENISVLLAVISDVTPERSVRYLGDAFVEISRVSVATLDRFIVTDVGSDDNTEWSGTLVDRSEDDVCALLLGAECSVDTPEIRGVCSLRVVNVTELVKSFVISSGWSLLVEVGDESDSLCTVLISETSIVRVLVSEFVDSDVTTAISEVLSDTADVPLIVSATSNVPLVTNSFSEVITADFVASFDVFASV